MDIKTRIKSLIKEADLYRGQGLLAESRKKYYDILSLVSSSLPPKESEKILAAISSKISDIDKQITVVEKKVTSPKMEREAQDLITKMFVTGQEQDENTALLEGAKALIKFGQFKRAIEELGKLISIEQIRLEAARHILNCYFVESKYDDAIKQYEKWLLGDIFDQKQLETLKRFIQQTLKSKGIEKALPEKPAAGQIEEIKADKIEIIETPAPTMPKAKEIPATEVIAKKPEPEPRKKEPVFFEEEDFEEFDVMASIKKSKKVDDGKKK
jgi:tetratricopeptide (TPR) repeat protein